jgi:hypothetical protein
MTFTLVSHLREQLSQLVRSKLEEQRQRDSEKDRLALEVSCLPWSKVKNQPSLCAGGGKTYCRHSRNRGIIQGLERKVRQGTCHQKITRR